MKGEVMGGMDLAEKPDVWLANATMTGNINGSLILFVSCEWTFRNLEEL
jgi:hypothetical protein